MRDLDESDVIADAQRMQDEQEDAADEATIAAGKAKVDAEIAAVGA